MSTDIPPIRRKEMGLIVRGDTLRSTTRSIIQISLFVYEEINNIAAKPVRGSIMLST